MKMSFSFFFVFYAILLIAQQPTAKFNNAFTLQNGIYTCYEEILTNAPSFPNCILHTSKDMENDPDNINLKHLNYSVMGDERSVINYTYPLFATVFNGKLNVYFQNELTSVYSKGTICTFIFIKDPVYYTNKKFPNKQILNNTPQTLTPSYQPKTIEEIINPTIKAPTNPTTLYPIHYDTPRHSNYKTFICMLDIQTGQVTKLTKENLGLSIQRDSVLYAHYVKTKPGKKNKNLFKYISEFNERNTTLVPYIETEVPVMDEE